jgi:hypothetical protein
MLIIDGIALGGVLMLGLFCPGCKMQLVVWGRVLQVTL